MNNKHFTRLIKAASRLREFNFRKLPSTAGELYHVDVSDDRGNRIIFKMQQEGAQWRIVDHDLPVWIANAEKELNDKIAEENE